MAEFKKTLTPQEFRANTPTVFDDPSKGFKAGAAETLGRIAKGAGQGYAKEKGEQQLGTESDADANQYVSDAFSAQAPAATPNSGSEVTANTAVPTKDEVGTMRADFLNQADLSDKKLRAAMAQGKISSKEANDRRIQNRKEFASNPLSAMFLADYDNAVGGGTSGAARGSFFGQTTEEKIRDKLQMENAIADNERLRRAQDIADNTGRSMQESMAVVSSQDYNAEKLKRDTVRSKMAELSTSEERVHHGMIIDGVYNQINQTLEKIQDIDGGVKGPELEKFYKSLAVTKAEELQRIQDSNMSPTGKKFAAQEVTERLEHYAADAKDGSYAAAEKRMGERTDSTLKRIANVRLLNIIRKHPILRSAFAIGKEEGMFKVAEMIMYWETPAGKAELATSSATQMLRDALTDEDFAQVAGDALQDLINPKPEGAAEKKPKTELQKTLQAKSVHGKGIPALMEAAYEDNPESYVNNALVDLPNLALGTMASNPEWAAVTKRTPELMLGIIDVAASNSMTLQQNFDKTHIHVPYRNRVGLVPKNIKITPPSLGRGANDKRSWQIDAGDIKLSPRYKADLIGAYRLATDNPQLWEGQYASVDDFINHRFTREGGGITPMETGVTPTPATKPPAAPRNMNPKSRATSSGSDPGTGERQARHNNRAHMNAEYERDNPPAPRMPDDSGSVIRVPIDGGSDAGKAETSEAAKVSEASLGKRVWAPLYNADSSIPLAEREASYDAAQSIEPTASVMEAAQFAVGTGAFDQEMRRFGTDSAELFKTLLDISKVESSGGNLPKKDQVSETGAQGLWQVTESTARSVLREKSPFGEKAASAIGIDIETLRSMSREELQTLLLNNDNANAMFAMATIFEKLDAEADKR